MDCTEKHKFIRHIRYDAALQVLAKQHYYER